MQFSRCLSASYVASSYHRYSWEYVLAQLARLAAVIIRTCLHIAVTSYTKSGGVRSHSYSCTEQLLAKSYYMQLAVQGLKVLVSV